MYNTPPATVPPFVQHDNTSPYHPHPIHADTFRQDANGDIKPSPTSQSDVPGPISNHPVHRDGMGHHRRGGARRGSFAGRKPPCLFFPAGRCKNGYVYLINRCFRLFQ